MTKRAGYEFYYITPVENLEGILKNGLKCRELAEREGLIRVDRNED